MFNLIWYLLNAFVLVFIVFRKNNVLHMCKMFYNFPLTEHSQDHALTLSGFSFRYGGSPSTISMAMMPRDQMSTLGPYALRVTTSGAIQYGVPTMVLRLLCSGVIWAQNPKSAVRRRRREEMSPCIHNIRQKLAPQQEYLTYCIWQYKGSCKLYKSY